MKKVTQVLKILTIITILSISSLVLNISQVNASNEQIIKIAEETETTTVKPDNKKETSSQTSLTDIFNAGSNWINEGQEAANKAGNTSEEYFALQLVGIGQVLVAVGVVTILIVSVIMAINWITATPDKKAKLKQQLIGLVVATVVIFGAIGIWNIVREIMKDIEGELGVTQTAQSSSIGQKL